MDRTKQIWHKKKWIYDKSRLHIVTPSKWLEDEVRRSILANSLSIRTIPYGLDTSIYRPRNKKEARWALEVPDEAFVMIFNAQSVGNRRKGFHYLLEALRQLNDIERIILLTVGTYHGGDEFPPNVIHRSLGTLEDEGLMSLAFSAADILVFPSLADNLPLVVLEALACGTPAVAFDIGGVPEIVRHMKTGYLAQYKDVDDFARGIRLLQADTELRAALSAQSREVALQEYTLDLQVDRYLEIYQEAIEAHQAYLTQNAGLETP